MSGGGRPGGGRAVVDRNERNKELHNLVGATLWHSKIKMLTDQFPSALRNSELRSPTQTSPYGVFSMPVPLLIFNLYQCNDTYLLRTAILIYECNIKYTSI